MEKQRGFQKQVGTSLAEGHSVLQVAPTGLGKTRAAIEPFTSGDGNSILSTRLLYTLPLRSLAEGVCQELVGLLAARAQLTVPQGLTDCRELRKWLASSSGISVGMHYGEKPESHIFSERAGITTIDQYLAAFAGAPLSSFTDTTTGWRLGRAKVGHAVAGAVLTSYSVFDEVHLLDPKYGLQLLMAVLNQRRRWGLLSTVSTATLPDTVIEYLTSDPDGSELTLVQPSREDIASRDDHRRVTLELAQDLRELPQEELLHLCRSGLEQQSKVILFANTVERALRYYQALKGEIGSERIMLIHSRFAPDDRSRKEEQVREWFGKDSRVAERLLVTTQVAEAGLNISAPLVISELCPADSLVQRAGRCARFVKPGEVVNGRVVVFKPSSGGGNAEKNEGNYWSPYPQVVIKLTEDALPGYQRVLLDWPKEQKLVNAALDEIYGAWVRGEDYAEDLDKKGQPQKRRSGRLRPVDALGPFERAFRSHSPRDVEEILRNPEGRPLSVQVAIAESEEQARSEVSNGRYPETVNVPFGVFHRRMQHENVPRLWELDPHEAKGKEDEVLRIASRPIPGRTYLLLKDEAGYSEELGLTLSGAGRTLRWLNLNRAEREQEQGWEQTFKGHTLGTLGRASRMVELYTPFLEAWARAVFGDQSVPEEIAGALADAMKAAAMFHDVGKLDAEWQRIAREATRELLAEGPIARFPRRDRKEERKDPLPPHAAFAYPFLRTLFREANGKDGFLRPLDFIALAAARHHSLGINGAISRGKFEPFNYSEALSVLKEIARQSELEIQDSWIEQALHQIADQEAWNYADEAPAPSDDFYPIYCIAQRLVKIADWEDAGQRPIELQSGGEEV